MNSPRGTGKVLAWIVGLGLLPFVLLGGWMTVSGWNNQRRADAFCAGLALDADASTLPARAAAAGAGFLDNPATGIHVVRFSGWGRSDCEVTVVDGRVASRRVVTEAYD